MILVNTETIPGQRVVEVYGLVQGSTVRAKHVGRDFAAGLKNLIGGELSGYTELLAESRYEATERMIEQAAEYGANAIVNIRYATSSVASGAAELYVYGTAVRVTGEQATVKAAPPPLPTPSVPTPTDQPQPSEGDDAEPTT